MYPRATDTAETGGAARGTARAVAVAVAPLLLGAPGLKLLLITLWSDDRYDLTLGRDVRCSQLAGRRLVTKLWEGVWWAGSELGTERLVRVGGEPGVVACGDEGHVAFAVGPGTELCVNSACSCVVLMALGGSVPISVVGSNRFEAGALWACFRQKPTGPGLERHGPCEGGTSYVTHGQELECCIWAHR